MWLVDNQNWICLCNNIDWTARTEIVQLSKYNGCIFICSFAAFQLFICINRLVECLHIDDHDIDGAIRRKAVNFRELGRIVDEKPDFLAVFLREMLLCHLKRLINALADSDARHNHDELAPTVVLVQLIHGLDVGIGLADTGFHFNRQVIATFQLVRWLDLIGALYLLQMLQNQLVGKLRHDAFIPPAGKIVHRCDCLLLTIFKASVHHCM